MSRALLIKTLMARTNCSHRAAKRTVDDILETLCATLRTKRRLALSNFGSFRVVPLERRTGMNPRTGEKVAVAAGATVRFRPSNFLRKMVATRSKSVKMSPVIRRTKPGSKTDASAGRSRPVSSNNDQALESRQASPASKQKTRATPRQAAATPVRLTKKPASHRRNTNADTASRGENEDC